MKRVLALAAVFAVAGTPLVLAQSSTSPNSKPLAQVAKEEEARRKEVKKPAKVYTNGSLRADISRGADAPPSAAASTAPSSNTTPGNATPAAPAAPAPSGNNTQEYWSNRIKTARDNLQRSQLFADSLQTRINSLQTDFVNRDDPAQRAKIKTDLDTALAELDKVKKEIDDQGKKITAIEDEARRAGVPAGWLRPGA